MSNIKEILATAQKQAILMAKLVSHIQSRPKDVWTISPNIDEQFELNFKCIKKGQESDPLRRGFYINVFTDFHGEVQTYIYNVEGYENCYKEAESIVRQILGLYTNKQGEIK